MSNPTFFELTKIKGLPIYVNANNVTSVEFIGDDEDGYVAFLAMDASTKEQTHYAWGDRQSLDAMFDKNKFGSHVRLTTVVSQKPVSPNTLFGSKRILGLIEKEADFLPDGALHTVGSVNFND